jgi:hypothetical protein
VAIDGVAVFRKRRGDGERVIAFDPSRSHVKRAHIVQQRSGILTLRRLRSPMMTEHQTPEHSARHILRLFVGHFHATPGRVLREAGLLRVFLSDGWNSPAFLPSRDYAVEHGWLNGALDQTPTLTPAGYAAALDMLPQGYSAKDPWK